MASRGHFLDINLRLNLKSAAGRAGITVASCQFHLARTWYDQHLRYYQAHYTGSLHVALAQYTIGVFSIRLFNGNMVAFLKICL